MKNIALAFCLTLVFCLSGFPTDCATAAEKTMSLPKPSISGGMPLMEALAARKTVREFSAEPISVQDLSNLLWAAWGVSRPDGKRTVPTARNKQEAAVFAVLESGVWSYDAARNVLVLVDAADMRSRFGGAPLTLVYAARGGTADEEGGLHVGSMYQDVGLYCASVGLGNVVKLTGKGGIDSLVKLPQGYKTFIAHSIGRPK